VSRAKSRLTGCLWPYGKADHHWIVFSWISRLPAPLGFCDKDVTYWFVYLMGKVGKMCQNTMILIEKSAENNYSVI